MKSRIRVGADARDTCAGDAQGEWGAGGAIRYAAALLLRTPPFDTRRGRYSGHRPSIRGAAAAQDTAWAKAESDSAASARCCSSGGTVQPFAFIERAQSRPAR